MRIVFAVFLIIALLLPGAGCREEPAVDPHDETTWAPQVAPLDWQWDDPSPYMYSLASVWGSSSSDVFAVGAYGGIFHFDGSSWTQQAVGPDIHVVDVWGTSPTNVYAACWFEKDPNCNNLPPGCRSGILHYDGSTWSALDEPILNTARNIWGSAADDIWVTGKGIFHYDGVSWTTVVGDSPYDFEDVWGTGPDDVYILFYDKIYHFDGSSWDSIDFPTPGSYYALWGSGPNDIFAVGSSGRFMHYDGASWTDGQMPTIKMLWDVWGTGPDNVYAVGGSGTVMHYDGAAWSEVWVPTFPSVSTYPTTPSFGGIWGSGEDDIFISGSHGSVIHYDGTSWKRMYSGLRTRLTDIWKLSGTEIVAVGDDGLIVRYDGACWWPMRSGTRLDLNTVWGTAPDDMYAAGEDATILHYDGAAWTVQYTGNEYLELRDVRGSSATDVWAVGDAGSIVHFDGTAWTPMPSYTIQTLHRVWPFAPDDVWATGHRLRHYDGVVWRDATNTPDDEGFGPFWANAPDDIFVRADDNRIHHYDGSQWSLSADLGTSTYDLWGTGGSDMYAACAYGNIVHFDGNAWNPMTTAHSHALRALSGTAGGSVYTVGTHGVILRRGARGTAERQLSHYTVDYDDIPAGTKFEYRERIVSENVTAFGAPYLQTNGVRTTSGHVKATGTGVLCSNLSLDYQLYGAVEWIRVELVEMGGRVCIGVNDEYAAAVDMKDLGGTTLGGAEITVEGQQVGNNWQGGIAVLGDVRYFTIGGQELLVGTVWFTHR